ncbi:protein-glutamate methylesterase/protein-glutamine glutaminase [Polynucleobacter tropicus]|uniref:protein-glutamate methylesterase/protein-glutamine glutaminase n=1 Tax=Polynucleobacter tropicus TaxID=1743174 RepID=UPI0015708DA2|nr:chemotaxis response regulator protein-glutamate methylesterase [Polynucleobacter tropicus]
MITSKIRVLIVDDSAVIRKIVTKCLKGCDQIEVIGYAVDGEDAANAVESLSPDVVILDTEMPKINGIQALKNIRENHRDLPIIMFASHAHDDSEAAIEAYSVGASDCVAKPDHTNVSISDIGRVVESDLIPKIIHHAGQRISRKQLNLRKNPTNTQQEVGVTNGVHQNERTYLERLSDVRAICIGSSTGGPIALIELLKQIRPTLNIPIFIVQHMPEGFTASLATRLEAISNLRVKEAEHGEIAIPGYVYIARGGLHMALTKVGADIAIHLNSKAAENNCRPSVDVLFRSASQVYGSAVLAIVLTGMGSDGLQGCHAISNQKGLIFVQDEQSSVVWGMPGSVSNAGLASKVMNINAIAEQINLCKLDLA